MTRSPFRRQFAIRFHHLASLLVVWLLVATIHSNAAAVDRSRPPNIIYILADDAGYGDFGCYRTQPRLETPNIDRLAREGLRFTQHYAGCTVCAPSRCVLLTGLHTGHCRVRGNSPGVLTDEDTTIAQELKRMGYTTGCIGKWGVGAPPPLNDPQLRGFDYFYGYISMWHAHNFYPEFLIRNGAKVPLRNVVAQRWKNNDGRGVATTKIDYVPELLTQDVLRFLEDHREQPFFLYYALNVPHANNEGGRFSPAEEKGMEVPSFGPYQREQWPGPEKGFAAMMRNIDNDVGRILAKLKQLDLDDNTIVMFSSDNGPHQEGGHQMEFFDSNGSLRGMKRDLYEGGIRVPLIARWPGHVRVGTTDLLCGFQDMLPTMVDLAGGTPKRPTDGVSLVPTLTGQGEQAKHEYLYWEFTEQGGKRAIRRGDWKLIQLGVSHAEAGRRVTELYNLQQDPQESQNQISDHQAIADELLTLMERAHRPNSRYPLFASERRPENGQ